MRPGHVLKTFFERRYLDLAPTLEILVLILVESINTFSHCGNSFAMTVVGRIFELRLNPRL